MTGLHFYPEIICLARDWLGCIDCDWVVTIYTRSLILGMLTNRWSCIRWMRVKHRCGYVVKKTWPSINCQWIKHIQCRIWNVCVFYETVLSNEMRQPTTSSDLEWLQTEVGWMKIVLTCLSHRFVSIIWLTSSWETEKKNLLSEGQVDQRQNVGVHEL